MTEVYHIFGYIFATYSLETSIISKCFFPVKLAPPTSDFFDLGGA